MLGTHVLLEAAKVANVKRFIHISTDEVYGEQAYHVRPVQTPVHHVTVLYSNIMPHPYPAIESDE